MKKIKGFPVNGKDVGLGYHHCALNYDDDLCFYDENNKLHREDGPAFICFGLYETFFFHGIKHREDGPAQIWSDGGEAWYYNGKFIDVNSQEEFEQWLKLKAFQ